MSEKFMRLAEVVRPKTAGMPADEVRFGITGSGNLPVAQIVIGDDVASSLGWREGVTIDVSFNNEALLLRKSPEANWTLKRRQGNNLCLTFSTRGTKHGQKGHKLSRRKTNYYQTPNNDLIVNW